MKTSLIRRVWRSLIGAAGLDAGTFLLVLCLGRAVMAWPPAVAVVVIIGLQGAAGMCVWQPIRSLKVRP
jgi:hypothetical protein